MKERAAIDVVILPPDNVTDLSVEYNQKLRAHTQENILLGKTRNLPHISLLMGCLNQSEIEDVTSRLEAIVKEHSILDLWIDGIKTDKTDRRVIASFEIGRSKELLSLHESIVSSIRPFLSQDATEDDIADPPPVEQSTLQWINHFFPRACFKNFWPHITLGFGNTSGSFKPIQFFASRLAICHLGNHCTCAAILKEVALSQNDSLPR